MQIISVISQACDIARRQLTKGEQSMLIDICNGTMLTPHLLGRHLFAEVEDSFVLYPDMYEKKWTVEKTSMLEKIKNLDTLSAALLELWAIGFWAINTSEPGQLEAYIAGRINISAQIENIIIAQRDICDRLETTRSAFKSAAIAKSRSDLEKISNVLSLMI